MDDAHSLAAAAGAGLDEYREADGLGRRGQLVVALAQPIDAGHDRDAMVLRNGASGGLAAQSAHRLRRRADEDEAGLGAGSGEVGIFAQEAVAGMDGVDAAVGGDGQQLVAVEIGVGRGAAVQRVGLVRLAHPHGPLVHVGVDGHGADAQLVAGANDAAGDLAAVGDQHFAEGGEGHGGKYTVIGKQYSVSSSSVGQPA